MSSRIVQGSKLRTNRKLRRVSLYLIKIKEKQTIKVEGKMTKLNWDGRLQLHQLQTTTVRLLTTSTCTRCDHRLGSEKINVRGLRRDDQFRIEAGSQSSSEKKKKMKKSCYVSNVKKINRTIVKADRQNSWEAEGLKSERWLKYLCEAVDWRGRRRQPERYEIDEENSWELRLRQQTGRFPPLQRPCFCDWRLNLRTEVL